MILLRAQIERVGIASLAFAFALAAEFTPAPSSAACETLQRWFAGQPGSQLVLSSTNDFYKSSVRPRKSDTILEYSAFPVSHDGASWYKAMKHYGNNFGNGHCLSGFYDSAVKLAAIYSQYGTASDLTVTTVSGAPPGLPSHAAPGRTRNGVRFGMTPTQVTAIDGPGTLYSHGRYQRLTYNQGFKTPSGVDVIAYLGFLFFDGRLVAMNVGGGV